MSVKAKNREFSDPPASHLDIERVKHRSTEPIFIDNSIVLCHLTVMPSPAGPQLRFRYLWEISTTISKKPTSCLSSI
jgi:hypothetical protein